MRNGSLLAAALLLLDMCIVYRGEEHSYSLDIQTTFKSLDDTLDCLQRDAPIIRHRVNYGYRGYGINNEAYGAVFDLRGSLWLTQQFPFYLNHYPVKISGAEGGCVVGGVIVGTTNPLTDWRVRYGHIGPSGGNSAAILAKDVDRFSYSGLRIKNAWDGVRVNKHRSFFEVRNSWIDAVDDCIENDGLISGIISDNLFDGCFVFVSSRPGRAKPSNSEPSSSSLVEVSNNLVYMRAVLRDGVLEEGHLFKVSGKIAAPQFAIHDNVFLHYGIKTRDEDATLAQLVSAPRGKVHSCSGNLMLWLGESPFPGDWPNDVFPGCLTVLTGFEALKFWVETRENWINCHPYTDRSATDQAADHALCR